MHGIAELASGPMRPRAIAARFRTRALSLCNPLTRSSKPAFGVAGSPLLSSTLGASVVLDEHPVNEYDFGSDELLCEPCPSRSGRNYLEGCMKDTSMEVARITPTAADPIPAVAGRDHQPQDPHDANRRAVAA